MAPISISEETKRAANLRVLQRMDNAIIDILGSATHVVLYEFDTSTQAWEKQNCEGSMFVVKRSSDPRFNIVVMNRTSKDNFVFPMSAKFQKQVREPYFIFANRDDTDQQIRGAWFHDDGEREAIGKTLDRIVNAMSSNPEPETNADEKVKKRISNSQATATLLSALKIEKNHEQDDKKDSSNNTRAPNTQEEMKMLQNIELNKKELQLSLLSLINDERFIDLIHAQYLKIVRSRGQVDSDN